MAPVGNLNPPPGCSSEQESANTPQRKTQKKSLSFPNGPSDEERRRKSEEEESPSDPLPARSSEGEKRVLFQRLWSEEDEVAILNGLISYVERGSYPDPSELLNSIKGSLSFDATALQLKYKLRRLRKKYENKAAKARFNPTKPHERKVFKLSRRVWARVKSDADVKLEATHGGCGRLWWWSLNGVVGVGEGLAEYVIKEKLGGLFSAERKEVMVAELEVFMKKTRLMNKQAKKIYKALKRS